MREKFIIDVPVSSENSCLLYVVNVYPRLHVPQRDEPGAAEPAGGGRAARDEAQLVEAEARRRRLQG